jgi:hypothetical protein
MILVSPVKDSTGGYLNEGLCDRHGRCRVAATTRSTAFQKCVSLLTSLCSATPMGRKTPAQLPTTYRFFWQRDRRCLTIPQNGSYDADSSRIDSKSRLGAANRPRMTAKGPIFNKLPFVTGTRGLTGLTASGAIRIRRAWSADFRPTRPACVSSASRSRHGGRGAATGP